MMDEAGLYYGDGCVELRERQMTARIALGGAGTYTVVYQFVSADGHSLSESYTVEFQPTDDHVETPGMPNRPLCGVDYQTPEEPPMAVAPPAELAPLEAISSKGPTAAIPVWAWLGGPLVLILAGGLWWLARRKTSAGS
jgi:copper resistance protein C